MLEVFCDMPVGAQEYSQPAAQSSVILTPMAGVPIIFGCENRFSAIRDTSIENENTKYVIASVFSPRHCEERSDEAISFSRKKT